MVVYVTNLLKVHLGPFHMASISFLLSRGSARRSPAEWGGRMTGPGPICLCRMDMDTAPSALCAARYKYTGCTFLHPAAPQSDPASHKRMNPFLFFPVSDQIQRYPGVNGNKTIYIPVLHREEWMV